MCIPVQDEDSDIVIVDVLNQCALLVGMLRRRLAAANICWLCGREIYGRSVLVGVARLDGTLAPVDPVHVHDAHPDCAALLDDDDESKRWAR